MLLKNYKYENSKCSKLFCRIQVLSFEKARENSNQYQPEVISRKYPIWLNNRSCGHLKSFLASRVSSQTWIMTSRLKYKIRKIMHRIVLEIHSNIQFNNTHVVICAYCKLLLQYFDVSNNIVLCHYRELRRKGCVINTTAKSVFWQNTSATYVFSPYKTYFLLILTILVFGLFGVKNFGFGKFLVKAPLDRLFRMARLGRGSNEVRVCNESVM